MMWLWYLLYQWWYQQQLVRREGVGSAVLVVLPLLTWKMIMSKHDKSLRKTSIQTLTSHLSNVLRMCLNWKFWYPKVKLVSWSEISILNELRGPCFVHRELLSRPFGNCVKLGMTVFQRLPFPNGASSLHQRMQSCSSHFWNYVPLWAWDQHDNSA